MEQVYRGVRTFAGLLRFSAANIGAMKLTEGMRPRDLVPYLQTRYPDAGIAALTQVERYVTRSMAAAATINRRDPSSKILAGPLPVDPTATTKRQYYFRVPYVLPGTGQEGYVFARIQDTGNLSYDEIAQLARDVARENVTTKSPDVREIAELITDATIPQLIRATQGPFNLP